MTKSLSDPGRLANHALNPATKERCLDAKYVPKVLSAVTIVGFYDGMSVWAWNAGLPAKTGVGQSCPPTNQPALNT